jgi:16S rRNA processing protein RimM
MAVQDRILAGRVAGIFGVQGWIKLLSFTDPRENIFSYKPWWLSIDGAWRQFELEGQRRQGKGLVAKLKSVDDREAARDLIGAAIEIPASQLPALPEGQFYWAQLLGLKVVNLTGQELGKVTGLIETGANDVLILGDKTLIPFLWKSVITRVDLRLGVIEADWQPDDDG